MINQQAFDALPEDLKSIVELAAMAANQNMLAEFNANNQRALDTLVNEHQVELREYPDEVLQVFKTYAADVLSELSEQSELSKEIYQSYKNFADQTKNWLKVSELAYLKVR